MRGQEWGCSSRQGEACAAYRIADRGRLADKFCLCRGCTGGGLVRWEDNREARVGSGGNGADCRKRDREKIR